MDSITPLPTPTPTTEPQTDPIPEDTREEPNKLLHRLLTDNNLKIKVAALSEENPFIGNGFVLTDRPLLVVKAEYKKE